MYNYDDIVNLAESLGCKVLRNEPMSKHTTFKIGGVADLLINVGNREQLREIVKKATEQAIPFYVLGNGSNLLISDNGIRGCVIRLCGEFNEVRLLDNNKIECGAGATLAKLCVFAQDNSLSGLEFAWGIPGSVGGAAFMNAGAYGGEMKDVMISCEHITRDGEIGHLNNDELNLSYRKSAYIDNGYIITAITLQLSRDDKMMIRERMDDYMNRRKTKQPLEYPSAGSVFKRPEGNFAGTLIEKCGLKGKTIGGAMVSQKHAGFIVNNGGATAEDVANLVKLIQETVKKETGILLECEIKGL